MTFLVKPILFFVFLGTGSIIFGSVDLKQKLKFTVAFDEMVYNLSFTEKHISYKSKTYDKEFTFKPCNSEELKHLHKMTKLMLDTYLIGEKIELNLPTISIELKSKIYNIQRGNPLAKLLTHLPGKIYSLDVLERKKCK